MAPFTSVLRLAVLALGLSACATPHGAGSPLETPTLRAPGGTPADLGALVRAHRATVLVWWGSTCPCVKRYRARIADLQARYQPRGVAFVAIASNADDDLDTLATATSAGDLPLPALHDPGAELAQRLGVVSTPSVVVLGPNGEVTFHGWVDNERPPGQSEREAWLEDHLEATLAGGARPRRTPTWGCIITRSLKTAGSCGKTSGGPD